MSEHIYADGKAQQAERERRHTEQTAQDAADNARIEEQAESARQHLQEIDGSTDAVLEDIDEILYELDIQPYTPIGVTALYDSRPAA